MIDVYKMTPHSSDVRIICEFFNIVKRLVCKVLWAFFSSENFLQVQVTMKVFLLVFTILVLMASCSFAKALVGGIEPEEGLLGEGGLEPEIVEPGKPFAFSIEFSVKFSKFPFNFFKFSLKFFQNFPQISSKCLLNFI